MKRLALSLFVLVGTIGSQEVKHAPTVEQCRADQRLWLSKLEDFQSGGLADVSYRELTAWGEVMSECESVDPQNQDRYFNTISEIIAAKVVRLTAFLDRRRLWQQFLAEDAQGKGRQ